MRALSNEIEFVELLKKHDEAPQFPQFGEGIIEISQQLIGDKNNVINEMYEVFPKTYSQIIYWTPLF